MARDVSVLIILAVRWCVVSAICMVTVAALVGCVPKEKQTDGDREISLRIAPSKPTYSVGEPVELSIALTNNHNEKCLLSRVSDGSVTILSLTRDGQAVSPAFGGAAYHEDFVRYLAKHLASVPPGESISVRLRSETETAAGDGQALAIAAIDGRSVSMTWWPVDRPGKYSVTASYVRPALIEIPTDACAMAAAQGSAEFVVEAK